MLAITAKHLSTGKCYGTPAQQPTAANEVSEDGER